MVAAIIVAVSTLIGVVSVAVLFSRALSSAFSSLDSAHERFIRHEKGLLDRLMAVDYATFKAYQLAEDAEDGVQAEPWPTTDDRELVREDFP
jgi:hypothetical protein